MRVDCAELKGVEVFKPGHYAGLNFDAQHLDQFVTNFGALRENVRPRLKLGHAEKQILDQEDRGAPSGQPALGVMSDLRREGDRLVADFSDVPPELLSAIGGGAYRNVSIEFWPKFEFTNYEKNLKTGLKGPVMTAVALLGAELPAVVGLKDLPRLAATDDEPTLTCVEFTAEPRPTLIAGARNHPRTEVPMADTPPVETPKEPKQSAKSAAEITKLSEQLAARDAELVTLREAAAKTATLETQHQAQADEIKRLSEANARAEERARDAEADRFVAEFSQKDCLKVLPAERAFVKAAYLRFAAITDKVVVLSEDGKPEEHEGAAFLRAWLAKRPDHKALFSTMSEATKPETRGEADTFDAATLVVAKDKGLDMTKPTWKRDASIILCTEEPYKTKFAALLPAQGQQTTH